MPALAANTNTTPVKQTLARTEQHALMTSMDSSVFAHLVTPENIVTKILLTARKTLVHLALPASILQKGFIANVRLT